MPLNLDSCITGLFVPGNIGASSGLPPVVRTVPSLEGAAPVVAEVAAATDALGFFMGELLHEAASATDNYASVVPGIVDADVTETVTAVSFEEAVASAEAQAFLARTSGLDTTHINAYAALIDGLVADGIWSKLDVLHIYATQDSTTALLNLISSSYNGTAVGSPAFTVDRGFSGSPGVSTSTYIGSGFIPSTAPSPKFTRNSAHVSAWNLNNVTAVGAAIGCNASGTTAITNIHPKFTDTNAYFRITGSNTSGVAMADARGHLISNRSASNAVQGYKNGSSVLTNTDASVAVANVQFYSLANNNNGTANNGLLGPVAEISIGASLNSTEATSFYNRLRTYMTAVGVP